MESSRPNDGSTIDLSCDLVEFFRGTVKKVRQRHPYPATTAAESYLVDLMAEQAVVVPEPDEFRQPLTLVLAEANQKIGFERFERLRRVGDKILYMLGFFADFLGHHAVTLNYVETLGASAYASAGKMRVGDCPERRQVMTEISRDFHMFVDLIHAVSDTLSVGAARSHAALVEIYERWLETGSDALAEGLLDRGLVPCRSRGSLH